MAEGSTQGYSSNISNTISNNPFSVSVVPRTTSNKATGDPEPQPNECGFSFLQAFVVSYGTQQATSEQVDPTNENERMLPISNMNKVFKMDFSNTGIPARRIYEVAISVDQDGNPVSAKLQKKPVQGESGYRANPQNDTVASDRKMYIPVCETINENVTKVWLRENIHWSLPASEQKHPWKVTDISTIGEDGEWLPRIVVSLHSFDDYRTREPKIGTELFGWGASLDEYTSDFLTVYLTAVLEVDPVSLLRVWDWDYYPRVVETANIETEAVGFANTPIHIIATLQIRNNAYLKKEVIVKQITRTRLAKLDGCINGIPSPVLIGY